MTEGIVDNAMVSFYVNGENTGKKSSVKFGGYFDQRAIIKDTASFFHTQSIFTWKLNTDWSINRKPDNSQTATTVVKGSSTRALLFDPQFTYIYLPDDDFKQLEAMDPNVRCSFDSNFCKYEGKCEDIDKHQLLLNFNIIGQNGFVKDFGIKIEELFVTGKTMGLNNNNCYLKVFRSFSGDQSTWYVGNVFMEKYYIAFDQSPAAKSGRSYVQVIIAEKNPDWSPNDYVPEEDEPADPTDEADKEDEDDDEPGVDTSDMGEGVNVLPKPDDHKPKDQGPKEMLAIIVVSSLTLCILVVILASCCCKKTEEYKYKSANLGDGRTYTTASDTE